MDEADVGDETLSSWLALGSDDEVLRAVVVEGGLPELC